MLHLFLICIVRIRNEALWDLVSVKISPNFYYLFLAFLHVTASAHKGGSVRISVVHALWSVRFNAPEGSNFKVTHACYREAQAGEHISE